MNCPFYTALSPIHGRGLFSNQYFPTGSVLFKVSDVAGNITDLGRYVNHSLKPNIILHEEPDGYYAVTMGPLYQGIELTANYNYTPTCMDSKPHAEWK